MNCPNCNENLENISICPYCGFDSALYEKTTKISNRYYNQGLSEAKAGNLTEAAEALSKSVVYNRLNLQARNLLGLVYYEMGMIGEALKHWVISTGYVKEDNPASSYIDDIQANSRVLDKLSESISLYNRALEDFRLNNDDMAIIQLKKALDNNPKFVEAYNLLALCYIYQKSYDKALIATEKALEIDSGNVKALSYYKKLSAGKTVKIVSKTVPVREPRNPTYDVKKSSRNSFYVAEIITFLLGAACAFGILYMMIIPEITNEYQEQIASLNSDITEINQINSDQLNLKEEALKGLEEEIQRLTRSNEQLSGEIELQSRVNRLHQANVYMLDDEYEEAASIISSMDITNFSTNAVRVYNHIKETVFPAIEKNYYDEGLRLFNARRYDEAKELFEKAIEYLTPVSNHADGSYYFLGRIAEIDGDKTLARSYYEIIINDYPSSYQASNARSRLRNL